MARDRYVGEDTVERLLERQELRRITLPGGRNAFTGPGADQALEAMNAEAMTVDRSIIVAQDFSASKVEDMALFEHEAYHVEHGRDGALSHAIHDAEETAARAAEQMVYHRMKGGYEVGYKPGASTGLSPTAHATPDNAGQGASNFNRGADEKPDAVDTSPEPVRGYWLLRDLGMSHVDVVEKLASDLLSAMDDATETQRARFKDLKGTFTK